MNDILNNKSLKKMPFEVPEGYFDDLRKSLGQNRGGQTRKWPAYAAVAASVAIVFAAGGWALGRMTQPDLSEEDYIVFSEEMTSIIWDESYDQYTDAITDDDIMEYLIYTGTEIEELY